MFGLTTYFMELLGIPLDFGALLKMTDLKISQGNVEISGLSYAVAGLVSFLAWEAYGIV